MRGTKSRPCLPVARNDETWTPPALDMIPTAGWSVEVSITRRFIASPVMACTAGVMVRSAAGGVPDS